MSQFKEYTPEFGGCPYRYYLNRVAKVWSRPAAWLSQGLAVHEAIEAWEKSGRTMAVDQAVEAFRESYVKHTNRLCETTPNFEYWFSSGPYNGQVDVERRFGLGMEQVRRYVEYYTETAPAEVIWETPEGQPAVELGFDIDLDGVRVRGYIDAVVDHPRFGPHVRDAKSGRLPGDDFQLATYAMAVTELHGVEVVTGDYWMGRSGGPTTVYKLDKWPRARLVEKFGELDDAVKAERFDPEPEAAKCRFCSVNASCPFAVSN
ncbi:MAG: PD-(D/E)XK nuclease family protein [Umezawaea sp.]